MRAYQVGIIRRMAASAETAITVLDAAGSPMAVYLRPEYALHHAQQVVDWLEGKDQPLKMVPRHLDSWDPAIRYPLRKPRRWRLTRPRPRQP